MGVISQVGIISHVEMMSQLGMINFARHLSFSESNHAGNIVHRLEPNSNTICRQVGSQCGVIAQGLNKPNTNLVNKDGWFDPCDLTRIAYLVIKHN